MRTTLRWAEGLENILQGSYSILLGGLSNSIGVSNDYSVITGGTQNQIFSAVPSFSKVIVGGDSNIIAQISYSTITGGYQNQILGGDTCDCPAFGNYSFIGGGNNNRIDSAGQAVITGGSSNTIPYNAWYSFIGGGTSNTASSLYTTITGGWQNNILTNAEGASINGGYFNLIDAGGPASIGGGEQNTIHYLGAYAAIPGGLGLTAQSFAQFVAGRYNQPQGSSPGYAINPDDFLAIFGNGTAPDSAHLSNAWTLSNSGHSTVYHTLGPASDTSISLPMVGTTYTENTIVAEADVPSFGGIAPSMSIGVDSVGHVINSGVYVVFLSFKNRVQKPLIFSHRQLSP